MRQPLGPDFYTNYSTQLAVVQYIDGVSAYSVSGCATLMVVVHFDSGCAHKHWLYNSDSGCAIRMAFVHSDGGCAIWTEVLQFGWQQCYPSAEGLILIIFVVNPLLSLVWLSPCVCLAKGGC